MQLLCSHEGGYGHVVEFDAHEGKSHDSCGHAHIEDSHHSEQASDAGCKDIEVPDSELEDLSSGGDRSTVKAPALLLDLLVLSNALVDQSQTKAAIRPQNAPCLESESRRFARIVQIRC